MTPQDPFRSLLVLTPLPTEVYQHVCEPRRRGYEVHAIDYTGPLRELGVKGTQELIERTIEERKVDTVFLTFFGDTYHFPLEFMLRLREKAKLVIWAHDDEAYYEVHGKYYAQAAHAVVTTDFFSAACYRRMGIPAIINFTSITKRKLHPVPVPKDIDVSFVGDCGKTGRRAYIEFLRANGIRVESFGAGSRRGMVSFEEMSAIFSRSKINLNFSRLDELSWINNDDPLLERVRQNKGRVIEASMAGGFCLSEYAPCLPLIFDIGKEVDTFWDNESLLEKVRYYLAHEEEREAFAARAHKKALELYEYEPYMDRILGELREVLLSPNPASKPTCIAGPRFKERQVNVLFVHLLSLLGRARLREALRDLPYLFQHGLWMFALGSAKGLVRALSLLFGRLKK
ncbi:MAG: glycosyltransferase [Elusimicrobiota bacterium]|jgi:spore maturation protein CgeB